MTLEELTFIELAHERAFDPIPYDPREETIDDVRERAYKKIRDICEHVPQLVAEIRRLQDVIKQAEWAAGPYYFGTPKLPAGYRTCPWCNALMEQGHRPACRAFGGQE